jgi:PKD domain/Right handed beta helix region
MKGAKMTIYNISDTAGFLEAMAKATGGDTIKLASGDYGSVRMETKTFNKYLYDSPVTITSADSDSPATFSGLIMRNAENITFDNIAFKSTYTGDSTWVAPYTVTESTGITFRNSLFEGNLAVSESVTANGYASGKGLSIATSSDIVIENNEFSTLYRGLVVGGSQNVVVRGNDIHSIRSDGLNFAHVNSVLIENNYIHDFKLSKSSGDHADMIQFWTNGGTSPSTDITIRGNTLEVGNGDVTQAIFMRNDMVDRGLAGEEMFYNNVLIEENIIMNGSTHGITMGETNGLTIRNNSVVSVGDTKGSTTRISVAPTSQNVTIEKNAVASISGNTTASDWVMKDNAFIQNTDPNAPGYYDDLFFESSPEGSESVWNFVATPDSMIENLSAGATRLLLDTTPDKVTPNFNVMSDPGFPRSLVFDATHTYGPTGQVMPADATFVWNFGDGQTATGRVVGHSYDKVGDYDVTLKVLLNGQGAVMTATTSADISMAGNDILTFNTSDGGFYTQGYGTETAIAGSDGASVVTADGMAIELGGLGAKAGVSKEAMSRFFGADTFEMSMTLQADQPGTSWGEVARIHSSIIIGVQSDGNVNVVLFPDSGVVGLTTEGIAVNDGLAHDVSIQLDGASDSLNILIDGAIVASQTVTGSMPGIGSWGLTFGNPWGKQNFDGKLSAFDLDVASTDYPAFEEVLEGPTTEPAPVDEGALPVLDDFVVDFAQLADKQLRDDAYVEATTTDSALFLDGDKDFAGLGKLAQFESSEQLSFSVTYNKSNLNSEEQRLVWKNKDVGLSVEGDNLKVYVAQENTRFQKAFEIDGLGLDDTETHQVTMMVDAVTDNLQVILDGALVLDVYQDLDIALSSNEFNRGWKVGGGRSDTLDGEINDFRIDASAEFVPENFVVADDASLMG